MSTNCGAVDYRNACRICLGQGAAIPLFHATRKEYRSLNKKLLLCFGEEVEDKHGYPRNICERCYLKVGDVISFQDQYQQSCKTLEDTLKVVVKLEPIDDLDFYVDYEVLEDFDDYEVKVENINEHNSNSRIVFTNANQLVELIKPLVKNTEKDPLKLNQHKVNNVLTSLKKVQKNSEVTKTKENDKAGVKKISAKSGSKKTKREIRTQTQKAINRLKGKKPVIRTGKIKNHVIAACLLERDFVFEGENWKLKEKNIKPSEKDSEAPKVETVKLNESNNNDKYSTEPKLCELCGKTFSSGDCLRRHILKLHTKIDKVTQCSVCGKVVKENLGRHIQAAHGEKNIPCHTCGKAFAIQEQLKHHIKHEHMNIPRRKAPRKVCVICGKDFSTAKHLLMHVRSVHTGERPEECSVCGARFHHTDYLNQHMRLHTGETPYKCPVCNRGYAQPGNMKSHIKHNHHISHLTDTQLKTIHQRYLRLMKP